MFGCLAAVVPFMMVCGDRLVCLALSSYAVLFAPVIIFCHLVLILCSYIVCFNSNCSSDSSSVSNNNDLVMMILIIIIIIMTKVIIIIVIIVIIIIYIPPSLRGIL